MKGIYEESINVRIALERSLNDATVLARSHGSRIEQMYEKLYEYVVQASGAKLEDNSTIAPADGNKAEVI